MKGCDWLSPQWLSREKTLRSLEKFCCWLIVACAVLLVYNISSTFIILLSFWDLILSPSAFLSSPVWVYPCVILNPKPQNTQKPWIIEEERRQKGEGGGKEEKKSCAQSKVVKGGGRVKVWGGGERKRREEQREPKKRKKLTPLSVPSQSSSLAFLYISPLFLIVRNADLSSLVSVPTISLT